jgi:hypothetical protein
MTSSPPAPLGRRRTGVGLAAAWIVSVAGLSAWLLATSTGTLREELKSFQFWSLEICVFLGLVLGAVLLRDLLGGLHRGDGLRMGALATVAVALAVCVAPRTNRIYYDEQIYQSIGQNLADLRLAQVCNDGAVEYGRLQCASGEYNKQPYAYPHALSVAYRLFGVHAATAFVVNAAAMAAMVCVLYLLVFVLFGDREAAFFAGLLMALTPQQLVWSATAAVEPSASLAMVVALLSAAQFCRSNHTLALAGTMVSAAYAVQFRPESVLILPVIGVLVWPRLRDELTRPRLWWAGLLLLLLLTIHIGHLFAIRQTDWGTSQARLSVHYVTNNLRVNGWFYLWDERFPAAFTLLAFIGLPGRRISQRASIGLYFLLLFGIDLLFYAGSYNYGADVRYSLMTYPPLAIFAGLGVARAARGLARVVPGLPAREVLTAALAFQFLWYAPLVRATTEEAWAARADVRFARSLVHDLPRNSYVLTHNPGMFQVWGINAGQMSLVVTNPSYLDFLAARYAGGVYMHWNFWCNVQDPAQQELCRKILESRPAEVVSEYRERDQRFGLYRFTRSPASSSPPR